jgi:hypothetical protein
MVKKSLWALCTVALLAVAFALPASAQDTQLLEAHGTFQNPTPGAPILERDPIIFSNFGTGTGVWQANGWLILGATSPSFGNSQDIAQPFTPKKAAHAKRAEVPVQFYNVADGGTNGFEISIQADMMGVPSGVPLAPGAQQEVANTNWQACCLAGQTVIANFLPGGVMLAAGTQYWLVVDTIPAADAKTEDVWAEAGTGGNYGYDVNMAGWGAAPASKAPAAYITGSEP